MKRIIAIAAAALALTGCATNGETTVERIDVNVFSRKLQFVELDESILDACREHDRCCRARTDKRYGLVLASAFPAMPSGRCASRILTASGAPASARSLSGPAPP